MYSPYFFHDFLLPYHPIMYAVSLDGCGFCLKEVLQSHLVICIEDKATKVSGQRTEEVKIRRHRIRKAWNERQSHPFEVQFVALRMFAARPRLIVEQNDLTLFVGSFG